MKSCNLITLPLVIALCLGAFTMQARSDTIEVAIAAVLDDLEESLEDNSIDIASSDLELGTEGPPEPRQAVGLRFLDIGIEPGSTINSASIQFMVDEFDDEATTVRIHGELTGNSEPFMDASANISSRARTSNSVVWADIPVWNNEGDSGPDQQTPDLAALVQEIINHQDWAAGSAMSFVILPEPIDDNTGERTAISFDKADGDPNFNPAILSVDFVPIPEPSSLALAAFGLSLLGLRRRRR